MDSQPNPKRRKTAPPEAPHSAGNASEDAEPRSVQGLVKAAHIATRRPDWSFPENHTGLRLAPWPKELSQGRRRCPHCDKRCPGWCYQCCVPLVDGFPRLTLPFRFTVLMHPGESAARNTAGHAPVLAPEHCTLVRGFEELAELPREGLALMFPTDDAVQPSELPAGDTPDAVTHIAVLDGKWYQAKRFVSELQAREPHRYRYVKLDEGTRTSYWRYHTKGVAEEGCCTVEAIYYFCRQWCESRSGRHAEGSTCDCYDNLLWLFEHQYRIVAERSVDGKERPRGSGGERQGEGGARQGAEGSKSGQGTGAGDGGDAAGGGGGEREGAEGTALGQERGAGEGGEATGEGSEERPRSQPGECEG